MFFITTHVVVIHLDIFFSALSHLVDVPALDTPPLYAPWVGSKHACIGIPSMYAGVLYVEYLAYRMLVCACNL